MVSCLGELRLWTLRNQTIIPENDIGIFTYHEKSETGQSGEQVYYEEKMHYTESRDATWTPRNKRPEKLRDALKEIEDMMLVHKVIRSQWTTRSLLQLYLTNGAVVSVIISLHTGDIDRLLLDKSVVGKLTADNPTDVLVTEQYLIYAYADRPKLDFVYFTKRLPNDINHKLEKLSTYDPKVSQTELPGPVGRKLSRHLVVNYHQDLVAVWWPTASEEAWPWSPMTGDKERANLTLLTVNQTRLDIITYTRTESDPLSVTFSMCQPHMLMSVEQAPSAGGEVTADICTYDSTRTKIQRLAVTTVPLKSSVVCQGRNATEDKVLLGCSDGTLVLYDEIKKLTQMTTAALTAHAIAWHPSGTVVMVASSKGALQLFDMALAPIMIELVGESPACQPCLELSHYFRSPPTLDSIHWSPLGGHQDVIAECADSLFILFDRGPVGVLQYHLGVVSQGNLTPLLLLNQYVKHRQMDEAVNLLSAQNWNSEGQLCYASLSTIVNHLLRQPLNPDTEAQLESALGTFYAPAKPLSEAVILEFRDPISRLARRFFHHLLRFTRFDKAFLLAVDIGARDLFIDIHYLAADRGELALAQVAKQKADQIEAASLGTGSVDGYDEISDNDESLEDSYDEDSGSEDDHIDYPQTSRHSVPLMRGSGGPEASRHPPPPEPVYRQPPADHRFVPQRRQHGPPPSEYSWKNQYMDLPEAALQELEDELSSQMFNEYTAALLDEIPPPQLPQDQEEAAQAGDQTSKTVRVIHFGIV